MVTLAALSFGSGWFWVVLTGVAMIALLFTSHRYVVGYFMAGMGYWLGIEALCWLVTAITPLDSFHAYILAVALSLIPMMVALAIKDNLLSFKGSKFKALHILQHISRAFLPHVTKVSKSPRIAGHKPFVLQKDTDFTQHYIRHTPVFDYEN